MFADDLARNSVEFQLAQMIRQLVRSEGQQLLPQAEVGRFPLLDTGSLAKLLLTMQQRRIEVVLDADLVDEVSWTILLDLYAAARSGKRLSISAACIGAQAPATTALRHIQLLAKSGLVKRCADPHDARRIYLEIEQAVATRLEEWLRGLYAMMFGAGADRSQGMNRSG